MKNKFLVRLSAAVFGMACVPESCGDLSQAIKSYGYSELRPPSVLLQPGTVVAVKSHSPFQAKIICTAQESLGPDVSTRTSPTSSSKLNNSRMTSIHLGATILDQFKTDEQLKDISSLNLSIDNPHVSTLTDTEVLRSMRYRTKDCTRAIEQRLEHDYIITMISQTLAGDVTYTAKWDKSSKMDGSAKIAALQQLAVSMGAESSNVSEKSVTSKGLIWGVKNSTYLLALSVPQMNENHHKDAPEAPFPGTVNAVLGAKGGRIGLVAHNPHIISGGINRVNVRAPHNIPVQSGILDTFADIPTEEMIAETPDQADGQALPLKMSH